MLISKERKVELNKLLKEYSQKEVDMWKNTFKVIASTSSKDRDWDYVNVDWWKIDNYLKNPVILSNHQYYIENIVWKTTKIYKESWKLIVEWVFSDTEEWKMCNKLYNWWFLKTVSVGFIPIKFKDWDTNYIEEQELLELSFVAVPSNPEALSMDSKEFNNFIEKGLIKNDKDINKIKSLSDRIAEIELKLDIMNKKLKKNSESIIKSDEDEESIKKVFQEIEKYFKKYT